MTDAHAHQHPAAPCRADSARTPRESTATELDPVCGMTVSASSPHHHEHAGRHYVFCSAGCKAKFAAQPGRYVDAHGNRIVAGESPPHSTHTRGNHLPASCHGSPAETPEAAGTIYTC